MHYLTPEDVAPLSPGTSPEALAIYIADVEAAASLEAPCLEDPAFTIAHGDAAKAILRQAVLRWARAGEGGLSSEQESGGPFSFTQSYDTRMSGEGRLLLREIRALRALCSRFSGASYSRRRASTVTPR